MASVYLCAVLGRHLGNENGYMVKSGEKIKVKKDNKIRIYGN